MDLIPFAELTDPQDKLSYIELHSELNYKVYKIKKPNGKYRIIQEPNSQLLLAQQELLKDPALLKETHRLNKVWGHSAVINGKVHAKHMGLNGQVLKVDLKDFYTNSTLQKLIDHTTHLSPELQNLLQKNLHILFYGCRSKYFLPTGAATSPVISNLIFDLLWEQYKDKYLDIKQYLTEDNHKFKITRYFDDITVSSNDSISSSEQSTIHKQLNSLIRDLNYPINYSKSTWLNKKHDKLIVTGVDLRTPEGRTNTQYIYELRAPLNRLAAEIKSKESLVYMDKTLSFAQTILQSKLDLANYHDILGKISYILYVNPQQYKNKIENYFVKRVERAEQLCQSTHLS